MAGYTVVTGRDCTFYINLSITTPQVYFCTGIQCLSLGYFDVQHRDINKIRKIARDIESGRISCTSDLVEQVGTALRLQATRPERHEIAYFTV